MIPSYGSYLPLQFHRKNKKKVYGSLSRKLIVYVKMHSTYIYTKYA